MVFKNSKKQTAYYFAHFYAFYCKLSSLKTVDLHYNKQQHQPENSNSINQKKEKKKGNIFVDGGANKLCGTIKVKEEENATANNFVQNNSKQQKEPKITKKQNFLSGLYVL